jgi:hypothetical protein
VTAPFDLRPSLVGPKICGNSSGKSLKRQKNRIIERSTSSTPPEKIYLACVSFNQLHTSVNRCMRNGRCRMGRVIEVLAILLTAKKLNISSFITVCAMSLSAMRKQLEQRAGKIKAEFVTNCGGQGRKCQFRLT